jgi:3-oxoacyl-[acyl-carrier protein] reductase
MFDYRGRVLWLTGANGAISRAVAHKFFDLGATCVLTDLDEDGVKAFAAELDPSGERAFGYRQDASVSADADAVAGLIGSRHRRLDFLVNAAGLYQDQMVRDMSDAQWRQSTGVNLDGVFYACRAAIPHFVDNSSIVNIASLAGHRGSYMHSHYASSKGAVLTFSRSLALELAPKTRVNAVSPGIIDTPMIKRLLEAQGERLLETTPMKRFGRPEEVGMLVAFLCSDWASFITAETVHVNGGLYVAS